jgi:hypothetical protein
VKDGSSCYTRLGDSCSGKLHPAPEKIVRGVYFLEGQKFVEPPYVIHFYALTDEGAAPIEEILDQFGQEYSRGPGIVIRRAISQDDSMSAVFEIVVWAQFKMYASILASRIDDLERAGGEFDRRKEGGD